jgi:hypothetical protein
MIMTFNLRGLLPTAIIAACASVAVLSVGAWRVQAQTGFVPEAFIATAVNRGEPTIFPASSVDIDVQRWSTEVEKDRFARTLLDRGCIALFSALQAAPSVGAIRTPATLPYELRFAWQEPVEDGGRRIILVTGRALGIWKDAMQLDPPAETFTVVEIRLNADDEGEGKVATACGIVVNRSLDLIELGNYASEPVRLAHVRKVRPIT